jgi:hypothetical protein
MRFPSRRRDWLDLLRSEEESVPGLAKHSEIATRVVLKNDSKMDLVFEVALDGLNDCDFAPERHVHDVGILGWAEPDAIA